MSKKSFLDFLGPVLLKAVLDLIVKILELEFF